MDKSKELAELEEALCALNQWQSFQQLEVVCECIAKSSTDLKLDIASKGDEQVDLGTYLDQAEVGVGCGKCRQGFEQWLTQYLSFKRAEEL
jgi:hypothetical protein